MPRGFLLIGLPPKRLFCKLKAHTGTIGTLSELADCLNGSGVADLAFFLKDVDHLRGVKHQPHSLRSPYDVALDGLCRCLEGDFAVLGVIDIGPAEWDAVHLGRELVVSKERERSVATIDSDVVVVTCQR